MLDQTTGQKFINFVLLTKKGVQLFIICVLHEPITVQGRQGMEKVDLPIRKSKAVFLLFVVFYFCFTRTIQ